MKLVGTRSFTLTTGNGKRSRLWRLKNSVPQVSLLAPLLCNIYISDLSATVSRKYAYANDLAIMHADGDGTNSRRGAKQIEGEYLQTWKLIRSAVQRQCWQSSTSTTRKPNVSWKSTTATKPFPFAPNPHTSEECWTVTYRRHLKSFCIKLTSRVALLRPRAYARGLGLKPPLEVDILQKLYYLRKEINCFRILFAC